MQKIKHLVIVAITLCTLMLFACQKESKVTPVEQPTTAVSSKISNDFEVAKQNWNSNVGSLVRMQSFKAVGTIKSNAEKEAMMNQIMADDAMAAYGNILDESSMNLKTVGELQQENSTTKETMRTYLQQQLNVGDLVVDVLWESKSKSFTSKTIIHDDAIAWDNLLTSSIMMDTKPVITVTPSEEIAAKADPAAGSRVGGSAITAAYAAWYRQTYSWVGNWIWGSKRGDMGETTTIHCYSNGRVYSTDRSDWANMALGSARSESKVLVNSGSYGKTQYALGIATPFASVSFNNSNWKVEVGGIGSSMVRNGTHTLYPW
ncbi:MAG: hypothetical protein JWQ40_811 [Segetibacter sp.]|jgi:hypothetical protein|nr:hypothetical protein [Segetibacter sp.]